MLDVTGVSMDPSPCSLLAWGTGTRWYPWQSAIQQCGMRNKHLLVVNLDIGTTTIRLCLSTLLAARSYRLCASLLLRVC
jgi:hypothetical protein